MKAVWVAVRVLISAAIIGFLVWRFGPREYLLELRNMDVGLLLLQLAFFPIEVACRVLRFHFILARPGRRVRLRDTTAVTLVGIALNSFIPSGLGEVARAYLSR